VVIILAFFAIIVFWGVPAAKQNTNNEGNKQENKKSEEINKEVVKKTDTEYNPFWEDYELSIRCPSISTTVTSNDYKKCLKKELQVIKKEADKLNDSLITIFSKGVSFPETNLFITWERLPLELQFLKGSSKNYINDICEIEGINYQGEVNQEIVVTKCKISETQQYMHHLMETASAWFDID